VDDNVSSCAEDESESEEQDEENLPMVIVKGKIPDILKTFIYRYIHFLQHRKRKKKQQQKVLLFKLPKNLLLILNNKSCNTKT
jgi:hypothetical protein